MTEAIELTLGQNWFHGQMDWREEQATAGPGESLNKAKRTNNQWEKMVEEQVRGLMEKPEQWNKDDFCASAVLKDSYVHNSRHIIKCSTRHGVARRANKGTPEWRNVRDCFLRQLEVRLQDQLLDATRFALKTLQDGKAIWEAADWAGLVNQVPANGISMREVVNQFISIMAKMRVTVQRLFMSVKMPGNRLPSKSSESLVLQYPPATATVDNNENDDILAFWAEQFPGDLSRTVVVMEKQLDLMATTIHYVNGHKDMDMRISTYEGELSTYMARRDRKSVV